MRPVISLTRGIVVRSQSTRRGPAIRHTEKHTDPKTNKIRNLDAPQEQLQSWGTIIPFRSSISGVGGCWGSPSRGSNPTGEPRHPRYDVRGDSLRLPSLPVPSKSGSKESSWAQSTAAAAYRLRPSSTQEPGGGGYTSLAFTENR